RRPSRLVPSQVATGRVRRGRSKHVTRARDNSCSSRSAGTAGRRAEILRVDATEPEEGVVEPASFIRTATSLDVLPVDVRIGTVGRHLSLLVRLHAAEAAKECAQVQATL